tara:strand:- start:218 stop:517 length:300 start_codon:yes stop_codon:yes gene_type:complete
MAFKMRGFSGFKKQTMQGKPSYENKKESKLLPSEMEGTFVVPDNDTLNEKINNIQDRIEFISQDIQNNQGDRATKQQREDLAALHQQHLKLRKLLKKNK